MTNEIVSHKVLVVGGCGYFGFRIIRWLIHETKMSPEQIVVVDVVEPSVHRREKDVKYCTVDIADSKSIREVIDSTTPDVVVHTASPRPHLTDLKMFMRNNVEGTRSLLEAAVAQPSVKAFVYTSSSSVAHDTVSDLVEATESDPYVFIPKQRQAYSHSKAVAEQLALTYNRKREDFVVAAIRPSVLFGPGEQATIVNTVARAKRGSLRYQVGDGTNTIDFTYVDNTVLALILLVSGLLRAVERDSTEVVPEDMRIEGEAFIVTNDEHRRFWDFFRQVGAAAGHPTDPSQIVAIPKSIGIGIAALLEWVVWAFTLGTKISPIRKADLTYSSIIRTFDISKAKRRLGYRPRFSIDEGIKLSVAPLVEREKGE